MKFAVLQMYAPTCYERAAADDTRQVLVSNSFSELKLNLKFVKTQYQIEINSISDWKRLGLRLSNETQSQPQYQIDVHPPKVFGTLHTSGTPPKL